MAAKPWDTRSLSALLAAAAAAAALFVLLGCPAKRGHWSDGWYSEEIKLEGPAGQQTLDLRYHLGELAAPWQRGASPHGDISYFHPTLGATIYSDSSCGTRYEDAPLVVLLNHLLFGFTEVKTLREEESSLASRAALLRVATARLDGVPVQVAATVTKNGPCVFDLVYLSPPHSFAAGLDAYAAFADGLSVEYSR